MSITLATFHWLSSPLKAEAPLNTVAKTRRPITCIVNAQETKRPKEEPSNQTILWQPKEGKTFFKWPTLTPPTQTNSPSEPPWIIRYMCSGHVMSSSNIRTSRLDVMHAGDTHQTTSTQTPSVSQRTRTFAPNHHHYPINVHSFPPPTNHPTCTHKTPHNVQ